VGALLLGLGLAWWQACLPADARALVLPADSLLHATGLLLMVALALFALLMLLGLAAPGTAGIAVGLVALVLAGTALGGYERVREGARKPFVITGYMYSNGIRVAEAERIGRDGLLRQARWAALDHRPVAVGEQVFRAQCQMCHSLDGYLAIRPLVAGQDAEGLASLLDVLRGGRPGMPPILGTDEELRQLAGYLVSLDAQAGAAR
jgi:mono/diheme cytochrome c family protein